MNHKTKRLRRRDVRKLYAEHARTVRDQACALLGGDPDQAQAVTRRVFASMIGMPEGELDTTRCLPASVADMVIRLCLEETGNREVADWEAYLDRRPDEDPDWMEAPEGTEEPEPEAPALQSNVLRLRLRAANRLPATRSAREVLVVRDPPAKPRLRLVPKPGSPSGPEVKS